MNPHRLWRPNSTWPPVTEGLTFLCDFRPGCGGTRPIYSAAGTTALSTQTVDADGTLNLYGTIVQATSNTARLEQYGVLVEPTRTNLALQNRTFSNAAWAISNTTDLVVLNTAVVCKDGTTRTTNVIRCDTADGSIMQTVTSASAAHSFGFWIKRIAGTGAVNITINGGSTWTAVSVTSNWTRVKRENITVANPQFGIQMHVATDQIALDFGQCEVGSALSSDIPTTTGSVQRSQEILDYSGAGNFGTASGSIIAAVRYSGVTTFAPWVLLDDGADANDAVYLDCDSAGGALDLHVRSGGAEVAAPQSSTAIAATNTIYVVGGTWTQNSVKVYVNGTKEGTEDTSCAAPATALSRLCIGYNPYAAGRPIGNFALIACYNRVLTTAEMLADSNWMLARCGAL